MKKVIFIIIVLLFSLSLFACNKQNKTEDGIDIDISKMSVTVAYSQVSDMLSNPSHYIGKMVKIKGSFSVYYNEKTNVYYPAVLIKDATACCSQGLEFLLEGNPAYPNQYPKTNDIITIKGKFETYNEGNTYYCRLIDAKYV